MPRFVVCVPTEGAASVAPCGDVGGVPHSPVVMELAAPGSVSFEHANQLFAFGFSNILILWLLGLSIGIILSIIRR